MDAHRVPRRFDMTSLLALTAACALLFGGLKALHAPPEVFAGLLLAAVIVSVAQMLTSADPRMASTLCGAVVAPLIFLAVSHRLAASSWLDIALTTAFAVPLGGCCGYALGACCAGVFLVVDVARGVKPGPSWRGWLHRPSAAPPRAVAVSGAAARMQLAEANDPPVRIPPPEAAAPATVQRLSDSPANNRANNRAIGPL